MKNLFTKEKPVRNFLIALLALALLILFWWLAKGYWPSTTIKKEEPPPPVTKTEQAVPPPAVVATPPQKAEFAVLAPKKKTIRKPKIAHYVVPGSGTVGCVEIHFTTKPGDTVVKFPVFGPAGPDIAKDSCTAIRRAGDSTFGPWRNGFCPTSSSILCDFSEHERIIGQKIRLMGSYRIEKQGEHVFRLPGFIAGKESGYVTALVLVRGRVEQPKYPTEQPGDTKAFVAASKYGEQRQEWIVNNSDAIGVRWFDYTKGTARVYYSKSEVPKDAAQLYWPWGEWSGP